MLLDAPTNSIRTRERGKLIFILVTLTLLAAGLTACNLPGGGGGTPTSNSALETMVAGTLAAVSQTPPTQLPATPGNPPPTAELPLPTNTPTATSTQVATQTSANVEGKICFPGETIPTMTIYFENTQSKEVIELPVKENQDSYEINLAPGTYEAYAWLADFSRGGLYSKAVPCGLKSGCDDHTILPFRVSKGTITQGIDLCDWYAGPFIVPYPPGKEPGEVTGSITGSLSYPGGRTPSLNVVAFNLDTGNWYYVKTNPGWTAYTVSELPPGTYHVVAYDESGHAGGHADAGHNLIDLTVKAGEKTAGGDINDWNAPSGAFPPDPTR